MSTRRIEFARKRQERGMNDLCTATAPGTVTRDSDGEVTTASSTLFTNLKCSYWEATGSERLSGGAIAGMGDFFVEFPAHTNIPDTATLSIAARDGAAAHTLQVKAVLHRGEEIKTLVLATEG